MKAGDYGTLARARARGADESAVVDVPDSKPVRVALKSGDTLGGLLARAGISSSEARAATKALRAFVDPRSLDARQEISLHLWPDGGGDGAVHLASLSLDAGAHRLVLVRHRRDERFDGQVQPIDHARRVVSAAGKIETSLYAAAVGRGVPDAILLQAYARLGYAVDFQRDIRSGDAFELAYESFDDGENGGQHPGSLLYASLALGSQSLSIFRYTTSDGYTGFFDADGRSIETALMKTPVDGGRLSSLFGKREHPVLGYTRMHKGLDFAAPRRAPVLAAGDGVVTRRGRYGDMGNYIRINHGGTYATAYAHLSRYTEGLKSGSRVRQGDVIGYVGATGLATGPNLHFEVFRNGVQVNPMTLKLPPRRVLTSELAKFRQQRAELISALIRVPGSVTGALSDANAADGIPYAPGGYR